MQDYRRLKVTDRFRSVVRATYRFTPTLPPTERFGLANQMRRAAISIALNIAEGCSRQTTREFVRFLEIARGSGMELELAITLTQDLEMGSPELRAVVAEELNHGQRQLSLLITSLRKRLSTGARL